MPCVLVCTSHSPLLNTAGAAPAEVEQEIRAHTRELVRFVHDFAPDLVIQFGDDHGSNLNLTLMPAFCVGLRARALGDFGTSSGPVLTDEVTARACVESLFRSGVDVAFSYDLLVDHGIAQALGLLLAGITRVPVIPIVINCGGELRPPLSRVRALGTAVGSFVKSLGERRVLLLGSGGLSHDPWLPEFQRSTPEVQQRMIKGINYTPELLQERTQITIDAGVDFAGPNKLGLMPLNPEWDRGFLRLIEQNAVDRMAEISDSEIREQAGRGGAEVRNWVAAIAALQAAAGEYVASVDYYRDVPELVCGYGIVRAWPKAA